MKTEPAALVMSDITSYSKLETASPNGHEAASGNEYGSRPYFLTILSHKGSLSDINCVSGNRCGGTEAS